MPKPTPQRTTPPVLYVTLLAAVFLLPLGFAFPLYAQTSNEQPSKGVRALEDVEQKLEQKREESDILRMRAAELKDELRTLNARLIAAARRVQNQESSLSAVEETLARLNREMKTKEARLNERREQFSGVVMALTRMSRVPTEALIVQPMAPNDMIRSAILLKAAVPSLEGQARSLRVDLEDMEKTRAKAEAQQLRLASIGNQHVIERQELEILVKRKTALRAEAISKNRAATSQMRTLAKKANTLRDLMGGIKSSNRGFGNAANAMRKKESIHVTAPSLGDEAKESFTMARGKLPFPVVGQLIGRYGEPLSKGMSRKGISLKTRPGAQVVAPFEGKVVFSGPFRGYGQLLIIDHGEGYHSLLAGLGRIDSSLGSPVLAGEPVAIMNATGDDDPVLYVEFRRDNEPVNPLPWLVAQKGNAQG